MPQTPHASTRRRTPSSGQTGSGAVPISMLPGPFQIAARTCPPPPFGPVVAYQLSDNSACRRRDQRGPNDRVHLHAHARRRHARRTRARSTRRSPARGLRHVGCKDVGLPTDELAALMDDIRSNGHETWIEVVSETEEDDARVGPRRGRDPPRPPDRRHADRAGAGDPRRHRREVLALRRADRRPPVPAARLDRRDRRRHRARRRARRRRHQPARLPLRRRRRGARRAPSSARPTCRSSAPARSTRVERIRALDACGAWAFTIGTAALDGVLVEGAPLSGQLQAALEAAAGAPA